MSDVFISYVEEDSAVAAEAARVLRDGGLTSWRYEADSVGGQNYLLQTRTEIEACRAFLIVLSPASMASEQVDREVVRAHECGKPFVPVLRDLTYADFARRRPGWQQAMGAATALTVPEDGLAEVGARIVAGVRAAAALAPSGDRPAPSPPSATRRVARVLRSRRTRRLAGLLLVLGLGTWFGVHVWNQRREAEDRKAAAEAKLEATRLLDAGRRDAALPVLERALALTPQDGEIQLLLGRLRYENFEPKLAIDHLDRRVLEAPTDALARYWRGRTNEALDKRDAAIEDLSIAISSGSLPTPLYVEALFSQGLGLLDRGQPEDPIRLDLNDAQRSDARLAEADFSHILELREMTDALVQRGRARSRLGKDDDAEDDLLRAYDRCRNSNKEEDLSTVSNATYFMGLIALRRAFAGGKASDGSRAADFFDASLRATPNRMMAKLMLAIADVYTRSVSRGVKSLDELVARLPSDDPQRPLAAHYLEEMRKLKAAMPVQDLVLKGNEVVGSQGAGVEFRASGLVRGRKDVACRAVLQVFSDHGSGYVYRWTPLRTRDPRYRTSDDFLGVEVGFVPKEDSYRLEDLRVYLPFAVTDPAGGSERLGFTFFLEDSSGVISDLIQGNFLATTPPR